MQSPLSDKGFSKKQVLGTHAGDMLFEITIITNTTENTANKDQIIPFIFGERRKIP
jgi:hypothetical protein